MKKFQNLLIGLVQAVGVSVYCLLIAGFFWVMDNFAPDSENMIFAMSIMLMLLVLSAAICGLTVFGYPLYLVINKEVKKALYVLAWTFLFLLLIIAKIIIIFSLLY
ncbi:MAG: hypothetical protein V1898_02450 [Patescibacteria group bacterium]